MKCFKSNSNILVIKRAADTQLCLGLYDGIRVTPLSTMVHTLSDGSP